MVTRDFRHVETRMDRTVWVLEAKRAEIREQKARLTAVKVTWFGEPGALPVVITSDAGRIDFEKRNAELSGRVRAERADGAVLETERLVFDDRRKLLLAPQRGAHHDAELLLQRHEPHGERREQKGPARRSRRGGDPRRRRGGPRQLLRRDGHEGMTRCGGAGARGRSCSRARCCCRGAGRAGAQETRQAPPARQAQPAHGAGAAAAGADLRGHGGVLQRREPRRLHRQGGGGPGGHHDHRGADGGAFHRGRRGAGADPGAHGRLRGASASPP